MAFFDFLKRKPGGTFFGRLLSGVTGGIVGYNPAKDPAYLGSAGAGGVTGKPDVGSYLTAALGEAGGKAGAGAELSLPDKAGKGGSMFDEVSNLLQDITHPKIKTEVDLNPVLKYGFIALIIVFIVKLFKGHR